MSMAFNRMSAAVSMLLKRIQYYPMSRRIQFIQLLSNSELGSQYIHNLVILGSDKKLLYKSFANFFNSFALLKLKNGK